MHIRTRDKKARAEEYELEYDEAYIEALLEEIEGEFGSESYELKATRDHLDGLSADEIDSSTIETIAAGFTDDAEDDFIELFSNFTFPGVNYWCWTQVDNDICEMGDQQRDLERDRAWEETR